MKKMEITIICMEMLAATIKTHDECNIFQSENEFQRMYIVFVE